MGLDRRTAQRQGEKPGFIFRWVQSASEPQPPYQQGVSTGLFAGLISGSTLTYAYFYGIPVWLIILIAATCLMVGASLNGKPAGPKE